MNERFKPSVLLDASNQVDAQIEPLVTRAELLRAKGLINLRSSQQFSATLDPESADRLSAGAVENLRWALCMNPGDSFLWAQLYSLHLRINGFSHATIGYLDESYATGPFEGWIAISRNRISLAIFPMLSGHVQGLVVAEFAALVDYGFVDDATLILTGVGWQYRDRLLAGLAQTDAAARERFRKSLSSIGAKVSIPGDEVEERPWR
ncbi:hypothetical protein [Bradyrhizobium sp. CW10]|uniref:hypothetical protein n=1 Tax=Bradyrhizobium sp. CW10 TaxID=2782683 RepID=UPI001FF9B0AD|nr:hypothetical protein [Bradyrhizobium sp. CW10]MCK1468409.1 hypothetical protein [Bradyrhizobium sp. CW10]